MGMSPDGAAQPGLLLSSGPDGGLPYRSDVFHNAYRAHARGRAAWPSASGQ
jgi:hypothetical protein